MAQTNYLQISSGGYGFFIVPRLKDASRVFFYTPESKLKTMGDNLREVSGWEKLERVSDYNSVLDKDQIVIFDDVGLGATADHLRSDGFKVVGSSTFTDRIEDDRIYAMKFAERLMSVPKFTGFTNFDEAIYFLKTKKPEERFVFKPNDSSVPKDYTYVGKSVADLIEALKTFKDSWQWREDFILQEFIDGTEVDFSAWFNGTEYLKNSMMIYFENKPFMNDDKGPATGGAIAVEFARPVEGVFGEILQKAIPYLQKSGYRGQISINCKVDKDGRPWFLEFTPRFGYPSLPMDIALLEDNGKSFDDLIHALVDETTPDLFPTDKIGVVVDCSIPPYPNEDSSRSTNDEPVSWDKKWDSYFFPYFMKAKKGKMVMTGYTGMIAHVTCADSTLNGAVEMVYKYIDTIQARNLQFRTDLGVSAKKRIEELRKLKIL